MATQIQLRRDTQSNWSSANTVLALGEIGYATDLYKFKIGMDPQHGTHLLTKDTLWLLTIPQVH